MAANPPIDAPVTTTPAVDPKRRDPAILAISAATLLALGLFIAYLLGNLDLEQFKWDRAIYLLNAVEAVAFAAAGYIFAAQVQRAQVETLTKKAEENAAEAQAGKTLAGKIHEKNVEVQAFARGAASGTAAFAVKELADPVNAAESIRALDELHDEARRLFPKATRPGGAA